MREKERFVIVSVYDCPSRRLVAEWVEGIGYCYMTREEDKLLRIYDGMEPSRPTPIQAFGFEVKFQNSLAHFNRHSRSSATYDDGKLRLWQDTQNADSFTLPLVKVVKRRGAQMRLRSKLVSQ